MVHAAATRGNVISGAASRGEGPVEEVSEACVPFRAWLEFPALAFSRLPHDPAEVKIDLEPRADGSCCLRMWGSGLVNQRDGPQSPGHKLSRLDCDVSEAAGWERSGGACVHVRVCEREKVSGRGRQNTGEVRTHVRSKASRKALRQVAASCASRKLLRGERR